MPRKNQTPKKLVYCITSEDALWLNSLQNYNIYYSGWTRDNRKIFDDIKSFQVNAFAAQQENYKGFIDVDPSQLGYLDTASIQVSELVDTGALVRSSIVLFDVKSHYGFEKVIEADSLGIPVITICDRVSYYYSVGMYSTLMITNPKEQNMNLILSKFLS